MVTCYEAGAFGFHLHRRLEELGIKNYVVQPQDWDERGKGVKNDRLDAAVRPHGIVAGRAKAVRE